VKNFGTIAPRLIPSLEKNDPSARAVMAGLDPAIQTCGFRAWMPGSIPELDPGTGMTPGGTKKEIWYYRI
jgi:hypothetical protein